MNAPRVLTILIASLLTTGQVQAQLTPHEVIAAMKKGINMGNTLEPPYEGDWQDPAQEVYFDYYKAAGFDMVRVPVRWDKHTASTSPYKVQDSWMDRVEQVLDWALSRDLFVVVNAHHDNWIKDGYETQSNQDRFDSIWSQIAVRFAGKSEMLIFEILNEPHGLTEAQNNELHQRVLNIIRKTNPTRNVIIQGNDWGSSGDLIEMVVPDDPYLIGSFHSYNPWPFGLEGTGSFGSAADVQTLDNMFKGVYDWSQESGLPVFLGEFSCHRSADYNSWSKHFRAYTNLSEKYGFTPVTWDDGGMFQMLYRNTGEWKDSKDILMHSGTQAPTISLLRVESDTLIHLKWNRGGGGFERITIEHRLHGGSFSLLATLGPEDEEWYDEQAQRNADHYYRIVAYDEQGIAYHSNPLTVFLPTYVKPEKGYFLGYPHPVPGVIEAEDFDLGGEGLSYHEIDDMNVPGNYRPDEAVDIYDAMDQGYFVGDLYEGEWMEYSIDVERDGLYRGVVHYASPFGGSRFSLSLGDSSSGEMQVSNTGGWLNLDSLSFEFTLVEGEQFLRFLVINEPNFMVDRFEFSQNTTGINRNNMEDDILLRQFNDIIELERSSGKELGRLRLISMSGKVLSDQYLYTSTHQLPTEEFQPGIYLVQLISREDIFQKKILFN